jgi:hypothetical protein
MIDYLLNQIIYPTRNPLYRLNMRQMQPDRLRRDGWLILLCGVGIATLWWLTESILSGVAYSVRYNTVLIGLFFGTLAIMLAANTFYILSAVNAVQQEVVRGTWDMLRLTRLPANEIAAAKFAVVQVRVWRMVAFELALRGALLTLILLPALQSGVPLAITLTITGLLLAGMYILEVWWRMRAVISVGLLLAAYFTNPTTAVIGAAFSVLVLHVLQAAFLVICYAVLLVVLTNEFTLGFIFGLPLCALSALGGTYWFYIQTAAAALNRLGKRIGGTAW